MHGDRARWPERNALSSREELKENDLWKAYKFFMYPKPASQLFHLTFLFPSLLEKFVLRHGRILADNQE